MKNSRQLDVTWFPGSLFSQSGPVNVRGFYASTTPRTRLTTRTGASCTVQAAYTCTSIHVHPWQLADWPLATVKFLQTEIRILTMPFAVTANPCFEQGQATCARHDHVYAIPCYVVSAGIFHNESTVVAPNQALWTGKKIKKYLQVAPN